MDMTAFGLDGLVTENSVFGNPSVDSIRFHQTPTGEVPAVEEDDRFAEFDAREIRFWRKWWNSFSGKILSDDPFAVIAWVPEGKEHFVSLDTGGDELCESLFADDFALGVFAFYDAATGDAEHSFVKEDTIEGNHAACNPED